MRKEVKTINSSVTIRKENFEESLKKIKIAMHKDLAVAYATSLTDALYACGWGHKLNDNGDIIDLMYASDHWRQDAEDILRALTRFIEPGSYIKLSDDRLQDYWRMGFDGGHWANKSPLKKEIIDYDSTSNLRKLFGKSAAALLRKGSSIKDLNNIIDEQCVDIVMDAD